MDGASKGDDHVLFDRGYVYLTEDVSIWPRMNEVSNRRNLSTSFYLYGVIPSERSLSTKSEIQKYQIIDCHLLEIIQSYPKSSNNPHEIFFNKMKYSTIIVATISPWFAVANPLEIFIQSSDLKAEAAKCEMGVEYCGHNLVDFHGKPRKSLHLHP